MFPKWKNDIVGSQLQDIEWKKHNQEYYLCEYEIKNK